MQELGKTNSLVQARRLLDEIATSGRWVAIRSGEHSVIYGKGDEELTVERKDSRVWLIVKYKKGEKDG